MLEQQNSGTIDRGIARTGSRREPPSKVMGFWVQVGQQCCTDELLITPAYACLDAVSHRAGDSTRKAPLPMHTVYVGIAARSACRAIVEV